MSAASDFQHSDTDSDQGRLDVLAAAVMDVVEEQARIDSQMGQGKIPEEIQAAAAAHHPPAESDAWTGE